MSKEVIIGGLIVIFISTFFILLIFDNFVKINVECVQGLETIRCDLRNFSLNFVFSLFIIGVFVLIDIAALYLMLT